MTNRERVSLTGSSVSVGRWEISTVFFLSYRRPPYDADGWRREEPGTRPGDSRGATAHPSCRADPAPGEAGRTAASPGSGHFE
ncbi:hypothetical protein GCM10012275_23210 [Longimycelium tulufanense]|uniref:Uncharacterized protein n=1 Tax=Longimycelium tulufanense TaxID=907463 RepID=A0A8J3FVH3_9PSEU|nr:hypothetical protein GCM10012275_23210 [Longimycelium tulufanense]